MSDENTNLNQGEETKVVNTNDSNQNQENFGVYQNADEYYRSRYNPDSLKDEEKKDDSNQNQEQQKESKRKFGMLHLMDGEEQEQQSQEKQEESKDEYFRTVKFMGEEKKVTEKEFDDLLQKGLNYDRKFKEFEESSNKINQLSDREKKILEFTGAKDFDELEQIIEQNKIQEEAQKILDANPGITEEYAQRLAQNEAETRRLQAEINASKNAQKILEVQQQNIGIRNNFTKEKHFTEIDNIASQFIQKSPTLRYDLAYNLAKGQMFDKLMEQGNATVKASTIANMQSRSKYQNDLTENKGSGTDYKLSSDVDSITAAFGNQNKSNKIKNYVSNMLRRK